MLNDCKQAAVDYVVHGHGSLLLYLTSKRVFDKEENGQGDMSESNPRNKEIEANEEDKAKKIEEPQPPWRRPERARRTPALFYDTVMVAVGNTMM